ncbi:MAG TPA: NlpC/P60 family protein [Segetibacter sp.]|nr:NlpC/P60 family protein [Segetibacter sp.]
MQNFLSDHPTSSIVIIIKYNPPSYPAPGVNSTLKTSIKSLFLKHYSFTLLQPNMKLTRLIYSLLCVGLLSSCSDSKELTSRENSATTRPFQKSIAKKVKFLDMSVSPGQVVTSKHDKSPSLPSSDRRKMQRDLYNASKRSSSNNALDIERADFLQLKYAIVLDATVEKLTNVNLLKSIDEWWGTEYCMGGSTKNCIDCSAFTQMMMQNVYKITVPRTAQAQYKLSKQINLEDLNEGDLVFFRTNGGHNITHVGIYLLNNKFVHASTTKGVMVSDLNDIYWKPRYKGAGRYISSTPTTASYKMEALK